MNPTLSLRTTIIPVVKQPLRPSLWPSRPKTRTHPRLLPVQFGDGKQDVILSFYHAPDIEILIKFDSAVPLELPDDVRFKPNPPPSFRDYLDLIYDVIESTMNLRSWRAIEAGGSTWCKA
jgi:hypothetical protein